MIDSLSLLFALTEALQYWTISLSRRAADRGDEGCEWSAAASAGGVVIGVERHANPGDALRALTTKLHKSRFSFAEHQAIKSVLDSLPASGPEASS